MMMTRAYEQNTSCGACAPSTRAMSCCAHAASMQSAASRVISVLDAILLASIIIFTLLLGELCLAVLLPAVILSICIIRRKTDVPRKRMFA